MPEKKTTPKVTELRFDPDIHGLKKDRVAWVKVDHEDLDEPIDVQVKYMSAKRLGLLTERVNKASKKSDSELTIALKTSLHIAEKCILNWKMTVDQYSKLAMIEITGDGSKTNIKFEPDWLGLILEDSPAFITNAVIEAGKVANFNELRLAKN